MFEVYGASQKEGGSSKSNVNFDDLNNYTVETAGLQDRETLVGYVSMIVDLGTQNQPDAEVVFTGNENDEKEEFAKNPNTYFKDGFDHQSKKQVRFKCWPQKPVQCVAVAVDFPDIMIDKGQFFGNSDPKPLRLWLGGQFYNATLGKMVVARPTPLKVNKKLGDWGFDQKHLFYKMAVADKMIRPGEVFAPKDIDKLLGKVFQFAAQVFFKEGKDGKSYYTEYVNFVGALGRGQAAPEITTTPLLIQMNKSNDEQAVKEVRAHVLNTCSLASNWDGSVLQKQVEATRYKNADKDEDRDVKSEQKPANNNTPSDDFDEEDLPF